MSLRKLRVLVMNLPIDSATGRAIRGTHWTDRDYLLADIRDTAVFHRYDWARAQGASGLSEPEAVPRPHDEPVDDKREMVRAAHDEIHRQLTGRAA